MEAIIKTYAIIEISFFLIDQRPYRIITLPCCHHKWCIVLGRALRKGYTVLKVLLQNDRNCNDSITDNRIGNLPRRMH